MATGLAVLSPRVMNNRPTSRIVASICSGGHGHPTPTSPALTPTIPALTPTTPGPSDHSPAKAPVPQLSPLTSGCKRHRSDQGVFDFKRVKTSNAPTTTTTRTYLAEAVSSTTSEQKVSPEVAKEVQRQTVARTGKPPPLIKRQQTLSDYVFACLAKYGLCVLDNFMGPVKANQILEDVQKLDESGVLKSGKTVQKEDDVKNVRKVRQDRIAFILKKRSQGIDDLVYKLDNLMTHVQIKSKQDPRFEGQKFVDFSGRTRAMVSCYPGNGTHYARHVDNHNKDGRCITVVYYINKNWKTDVDGGMLKVYPRQIQPKVANVEPLFDRVFIFWSDDRNPHEVLPAFKSRYAVTLWYFDKEERQKALEQHKSLGDFCTTSTVTTCDPKTTQENHM